MSNACRALLSTATLVAAAACAPTPRPTTGPAPDASAGKLTALPGMPLVQGPLVPRMVYPRPNQMITSKDSNFVFGSVGNGLATLTINGQNVRVYQNGAYLGWVANPPASLPQYELVVSLGAETVRGVQPVLVPGMQRPGADTTPPPPNVVTDTTPTWVVLGDSASAASDTDRVVIGRPGPNTVYRWFLLPGTRVQLTARYPGFARIRLDSGLEIWVEAIDARTLATNPDPPVRIARNSRVRSSADWSDLIIPISERPAFFVEERERSIALTLYDARSSTDIVNFPTADSLIRSVEWSAERNDRVTYNVRLSQEPFGYLVFYENNALVLRIRRRPPQLATQVLPGVSAMAGLTIVVDPGHPPAGATGPTGLYEGDAVLPVGLALERILKARGANVVMTRTTNVPVELAMRPVIARRANGHAFVSLHYNAYPDGVNPFTQRNGMEVYFYRPHSEALGRAVQQQMLAKIPLEDQGVYFRSLAVVRNTWMPAVLVEGGFIIIPEQENAMRTPAFQEAYARAVADGLEAYFRGLRSR